MKVKHEKFTDKELSPIVQSLKGILKNIKINETEYKKYLEEKYLSIINILK